MYHDRNPVPLPFYPDCFGCGRDNPRGLACRFVAEGGMVKAEFKTEPWMVGYENMIHGGIIGTVLDEALIWAAYAATGCFGVTAEMTVRFFKPLPVGTTCTVEGKLTENKGRVWAVESILRQTGDEKPTAEAKGKIIALKSDKQEMFKSTLRLR